MASTIVLGYDGKEPSGRVLERALAEARSRGARLVVLAALELPVDPTGPRNFGTLDDGPARVAPGEPPEIEAVLTRARESIDAAHVDAEYVWAAGDPARAIVDLAREREARLIVIGAHHHGLFSGLLGLDIESQVEREASCEVLVVE